MIKHNFLVHLKKTPFELTNKKLLYYRLLFYDQIPLFLFYLPQMTSKGVLVTVVALKLARHLISFLFLHNCMGSFSSVFLEKNPHELNHESRMI